MRASDEGDTTYDRIRDMIVSGRLAPGSRVIETEIAEHLEISRTPVREAISRLEREGYFHPVDEGKRKRVRVAPLTRTGARRLLPIVGILEGLAARWLLLEVDEGNRSSAINRLASINDEIDDCCRGGRPEQRNLLNLDRQFHETLVRASNARRFVKEHNSLKPQTERYTRMYIRMLAQEADHSASEHAEVIGALRNGNVGRAVVAIREHWRNALRRLESAIMEKGAISQWKSDVSSDSRLKAF